MSNGRLNFINSVKKKKKKFQLSQVQKYSWPSTGLWNGIAEQKQRDYEIYFSFSQTKCHFLLIVNFMVSFKKKAEQILSNLFRTLRKPHNKGLN